MLITSKYQRGFSRHCGAVSPLFVGKLVLAALLLAWLATSVVQLAHIIIPPEKITNGVAGPSERAPTSPQNLPSIDIASLKGVALFGEYVEEQAPVVEEQPKEEVVVETKLNLTLKGLFSSGNESEGRAIIANGRDENLYQVDDEIEGLSNVKLLAVFPDRVKLDNRGSTEVLYLYPEGERLTSSSSPSFAADVPRSRQPNFEDLSDDGPPNEENNAKKLNQIMRVVRERDKSTGDMLGFRVLPGRDREAFELSGLKVNDVITSIDGEPLTDLRSAMTIYRNKRDATQVSLVIRRSDSEISLDLDLNKLNI